MRRPLALTLATVLAALPLAPAAAADDTTEVTGTLERFAVDLRGGASHEIALVVPDEGEPVRVRPDSVAGIESGTAVVAAVEDLAEPLAVQDPTAGAQAEVVVAWWSSGGGSDTKVAAAPIARAISGTRTVHIADVPVRGFTENRARLADLNAEWFDFGLADEWDEWTEGAITLVRGVVATAPEYTGWGSQSTCTDAQVAGLLAWAAAATSPAPPGSRTHLVVSTPEIPACPVEGIAHIADGGTAWANGTTQGHWGISHLLGHTLTLRDSNSLVDCPDGPDGPTAQCHVGYRGDAYDVMGWSTRYAGDLNPVHRDRLGLLTGTSVMNITATRSLTLNAAHMSTGTRAVTFSTGGYTYYLELRSNRNGPHPDDKLGSSKAGCPRGLDDCDATTVYQPGLLVRRVDETTGESLLLEAATSDPRDVASEPRFPLTEGRTFTTADGVYTVKYIATSTGSTWDWALVDVIADPPAAPAGPFTHVVASPDVSGDGRADAVVVDRFDRMYLYPGLGNGRFGSARALGDFADARLYGPGDWTGDRAADLVMVDEHGDLRLRRGRGDGSFAAVEKIGFGWTGFRIVPAGDVNGDGTGDMLAMDTVGRLWLYPGTGVGTFGRRIQVGNGWNGFELYAAGDANKDGKVDIFSVDTAGRLWFYTGRGGGYFNKRTQVGRGWSGFAFASGADFDKDGLNDLLGRDREGRLWYYGGRVGGTFRAAVHVASGW